MTYPLIHTCPVCAHSLHATRLKCHHCETVVENDFTLSKFAALSKEQIDFIEVFVVNRGNIKEVEKELGISYPTVRGKLNDVISKLGHGAKENKQKVQSQNDAIISMLENDEISPDEAIALLKNKRG